MDSSAWASELSFMKEIFPNKPEYVGVFDRFSNGNKVTLLLKAGEPGILKRLEISNSETSSEITATVHEDKDVYVHHREVNIKLNSGIIQSFDIQGYQKMLLNDTVWFAISGVILD